MEEHSHCASLDALPLKGIKVTSSIRKFVCFANVRKKWELAAKYSMNINSLPCGLTLLEKVERKYRQECQRLCRRKR